MQQFVAEENETFPLFWPYIHHPPSNFKLLSYDLAQTACSIFIKPNFAQFDMQLSGNYLWCDNCVINSWKRAATEKPVLFVVRWKIVVSKKICLT